MVSVVTKLQTAPKQQFLSNMKNLEEIQVVLDVFSLSTVKETMDQKLLYV
jgi:hypothetical protein